jgi:predicted Ser/Thr protein kinase
MFPYWTFLKYGIPFLIGAVVFGGAAWKIQGMRLDTCKKTEAVCLTANVENTKTITALQTEVAKGNKTCEQRLASKDSTIKRLKQIDNLRGKDETNHATGNDLRDALNGLWDTDSKNTIR